MALRRADRWTLGGALCSVSLEDVGPGLPDAHPEREGVGCACMAHVLNVEPGREQTFGTAVIQVTVDDRLTAFHLHGEDLEITSATLGRAGKRARPVTVSRVDDALLRVDAGKRLKPGAYTLTVGYTGRVQEQPYGLFGFTSEDRTYLVTQLEVDEARTVWPCFDEPSFKVPLTLTVIAPEDLAVISNAPVA
jgi:alanyl aminopeptidase